MRKSPSDIKHQDYKNKPGARVHPTTKKEAPRTGRPNPIKESSMNQKEPKRIKDVEEPNEGPNASLALVLNMPISRMPELVRMAQQLPGTRVVYQRTSVGRLTIVEEVR